MRRRRIGDAIRLLGVAAMIVIAAFATYLEWTGRLDMALLPYFFAFSVYCVIDIVAMIVEGGRDVFKRRPTRS
jgi:hypothetical protein